MNWLIRLGEWWESRRRISRHEFSSLDRLVCRNTDEINNFLSQMEKIRQQVDMIGSRISKLEKSQEISPTAIKELALINVKISQLELYVGLKREPKPEHVPGAAKIS